VDKLGRHGSGRALLEESDLVLLGLLNDLDGHVVDLLHTQLQGLADGLNDDARVDTLLHEGFNLLKELAGQQNHGRGAITNLEK